MEQTQINKTDTAQPNNTPIEWIDAEIKDLEDHGVPTGDRKPGLKMEENRIYELDIDVSRPWEKWTDPNTKVIKKLIPVRYNTGDFIWWLNCSNPVYSILLKKCKAGQRHFKIIRTGQLNKTRYNLVD